MSVKQYADGDTLIAALERAPAPPASILVLYSPTCSACVHYFGPDGGLTHWVRAGGTVYAVPFAAAGAALGAHLLDDATGAPIAAIPATLPLRGRYLQTRVVLGALDARMLASFAASPRAADGAPTTQLRASGAPRLHAALPDFELLGAPPRLTSAQRCVTASVDALMREIPGAARSDRAALLIAGGEDLLRAALALGGASGAALSPELLRGILAHCWSERWGLPGEAPAIPGAPAATGTEEHAAITTSPVS